MRHHVRRLLHRSGWEVRRLENTTSEYQAVKDLLRISGADIVLDVGANLGQFAELVFDTGFRGRVVSFEAIPAVHAGLSERARKRSGGSWSVAPCAALGSRRAEATINLAGNSVSSSLLPMRSEHVAAQPQSAYVGRTVVQVERLDELAPGLIPAAGRLLLKVDTQGYELEVLRGATALLPRIAAIQLELSLVPLYEGAPSLEEAMHYVETLGFELFSIVPGFKDKRSGRLLQMDGMFLRKGADGVGADPPDAVGRA